MEFSIALLLIFFIAFFVVLKIIRVSISIVKKTIILCFLLLILYAVFVNAEVKQVYSDFIFPYETLTVDKKPFVVSLEDHDKVMLKYGDNYFFIKRGECKEIYNLRFCFGNTRWDIDEKKEKINLTVYSIEPVLTVTRTISKSTLLIGEEADITTIIENDEGLSAEDAFFIDTFTPEFKITDVDYPCSIRDNSVYWKGYIKENDAKECKYTIKALDEIERSFKAKVEYYDGMEIQEEFSDAITIKVLPLLDIRTELNETDKKVYVGQTFYLKINLTNKNDEDMEINYLDIYVPEGLEYIGTTREKIKINATDYDYVSSARLTKIADNIYRFSSGLKKNNQSKVIIPSFKAIYVGKSNIFIKTEYETEGKTRIKEKIESIEVKRQEIRIHTNWEDGGEFDTGIKELLRVYVENPIGNNVYFKNLHVYFNTTLGNFSDFYIDKLNKSDSVFVLNKIITTPIVGKNTKYNFMVLVDYETEYGEEQRRSLDLDVTIKPVAGLKITHALSKSNVESGEEFDVEVKIKNERIEDIKNVRVSDTIHNDFSRKGVSSATININGLDEATAYKYKTKAPQVKNTTIYVFITKANYTKDNITRLAEKEFKITVKPKKLDLSIKREVSTPLFQGQVANLIYTIENREEEQIKDILFNFPLQKNYDLVGPRTYWIEKLDPYEKLVIKDRHQIRPKKNESQALEPTEFIYKDSLDNIFRKNSSKNSFTIENSYIDGPAFIIEKNVSKNAINKSELLGIILVVRNVGKEKGKIRITDMEKVWELEVLPGEQVERHYSLLFDKAGRFVLKPAVGEYTYLGKNITTASNTQKIEVGFGKEAIIEEEEVVEEIVIEEGKKGFIAQIIELIETLKKAIFGG